MPMTAVRAFIHLTFHFLKGLVFPLQVIALYTRIPIILDAFIFILPLTDTDSFLYSLGHSSSVRPDAVHPPFQCLHIVAGFQSSN